ncbi:MAG: metallophosphoesterase [Oscillospiraceae bacterium]|nr:metallophosphoesterase [Oscillospiraceae bacterium]
MIYVTGDMHGELERFSQRAIKKLKAEDTLIILGDFGFLWSGGEEEEKNLEFIRNRKFKVLFLDGTHENHALLERYPETEYCGGRVRDLGGNLKMLMRGEIYNIEDKSIFTLGGGQSADLEFRTEGESWWPQELPSMEELDSAREKLKAHGPVDFVLTHDAPQKIRISLFGRDIEEHRLSKFLDEVMMTVKYDKWYFGCYHLDRKLTRAQYGVYQKVLEITTPEKKGFFAKLFKKNK